MKRICINCTSELDPKSNFCFSCGAPVVHTADCPSCHRTTDDNSIYCKFCGYDLTRSGYNIAAPNFTHDPLPKSGFAHPGWITSAVVGVVLLIFAFTGFSYYSDAKDNLARAEQKNEELKNQLDGKDREINSKNNQVSNLETEKTDLQGKNTDLSDNLEKREADVARKVKEIKNLQGSLKTVSTCLVGVVRGINALQQNNEYQARQSLFEIQSTCEKSGDIIKQVEKF